MADRGFDRRIGMSSMMRRDNGGCNVCRRTELHQAAACAASDSVGTVDSRLLRRLQAVDFSIADTALYLDAYPHSREAKEYYRKLIAERDSIRRELTKQGMPMTYFDVELGDGWNWIDGPWPWENRAN